jgi:hypothetical protein
MMGEKLKCRWKVKCDVGNRAQDQSMGEFPARYLLS